MPNTRPTGTQPVEISLVKSWPDRSQVNGRRSRLAPGARTAVPTALNSWTAGGELADREPDADDAVAAEFGALGAHPGDGGASRLVQGLYKRPERSGPTVPRQLSDRPVEADHAVPERSRAVAADVVDRGTSTCPTGSKPALRIAANSSVVSALPHVPLPLISAIRASASTHATPFSILRDQPDRMACR